MLPYGSLVVTWRRRHEGSRAAWFIGVGVFGMLVTPAMIFAMRTASSLELAAANLVLGFSILVASLGFLLAGVFRAVRGAEVPPFAAYVVVLAVVVLTTGTVLALSPDVTVFLSTLVGSLAGIVVVKLEKLLEGAPLRRRRIGTSGTRRVLSSGLQRGQLRRQP